MDVLKRIPFRTDSHPELIRYLKNNGLPFDEGETISAVEILESNPHWPWILDYANRNDKRIYSDTLFSAHELENAKWLAVRSKWRNGYPQPEGNFGYERITYSCENHCGDCGTGIYQVDSFRIRKTPNWGKRHFMMLNWVPDELFLDDMAVTVLRNADLRGLEFRNVKNTRGTEILPNVNQLVISTVLPEGIVSDRCSIDDIYECANCGIKKYHPSGIGMYAFKKEIFEGAPDIVKTEEVFGWGHVAPRLIIMSQKMYQVIAQNKLDRALVFEPLELV